MSLASSTIRTICEHLDLTASALSDKAAIGRTSLSKVINGHEDLTLGMLTKLLDIEISDDHAAALAEDWTLDHWPMRAKQLLMIQRRHERESSVVREDPPEREDNLSLTLSELHAKARENPSLARALRNLNRTLDGRTDVAD